MKSALIGYTGFVGSNLASQTSFDKLFNTINFTDMRGHKYGEIVCAGVSGVKWKANKEPETDRANIKQLADVLETIDAERFILISTIDVYSVLDGVDEDADCHAGNNHAYGTHRLEFEDFCRDLFQECLVIRLPGLFGHGLKKNVIYDLLHDNCLEMMNRHSSYQYYCLGNLWEDIRTVSAQDIELINFFTEPIGTGEMIDRFFPGKEVGAEPAPEQHYDLRTKHAGLRGRDDGYLYGKNEVLEQMEQFISTQK